MLAHKVFPGPVLKHLRSALKSVFRTRYRCSGHSCLPISGEEEKFLLMLLANPAPRPSSLSRRSGSHPPLLQLLFFSLDIVILFSVESISKIILSLGCLMFTFLLRCNRCLLNSPSHLSASLADAL